MKTDRNERDLYIQYGSGWSSAPKGWRNYDASPTLRFERIPIIGKIYTKNKTRFPDNVEYGDIVKGLPLTDESCKAIYCSHLLEHLSLEDFRAALVHTYTYLQGNGVFRLVLPDLEYDIKKYVDDDSDDAALSFMRDTSLGQEVRIRTIQGSIVMWLGNNQHLWMWDYKSIKQELVNAGFVDIRRAQFGDSLEPMFSKVEEKSRWDNCLGVECRK